MTNGLIFIIKPITKHNVIDHIPRCTPKFRLILDTVLIAKTGCPYCYLSNNADFSAVYNTDNTERRFGVSGWVVGINRNLSFSF